MRNYTIITVSNMWSTSKLRRETESVVNEKTNEGYEIVTVSFSFNVWLIPTAYITICK